MIVVDASVAAKWVLKEADSAQAIALLESGTRLLAPDLVRIEVANAVIRAFRDGRLSESSGRTAQDEWDQMVLEGVIEMTATGVVYKRAVSMAFAIKHPLPDCLYLALAEQHKGTLVTADRTLRDRGKKLYPHIRLLSQAA